MVVPDFRHHWTVVSQDGMEIIIYGDQCGTFIIFYTRRNENVTWEEKANAKAINKKKKL